MLGDISHQGYIIGIEPDQLINLKKTLGGDKDLNRSRELTAEISRKSALV